MTGLEITYLSKEDIVSGQGKQAEERIYRTADGALVREGDPAAAFLAYPTGAEVPADDVDEYEALFPVVDESTSDVEKAAESKMAAKHANKAKTVSANK